MVTIVVHGSKFAVGDVGDVCRDVKANQVNLPATVICIDV